MIFLLKFQWIQLDDDMCLCLLNRVKNRFLEEMITKELKLEFENLLKMKKCIVESFVVDPPISKLPKKFNSIFDFEPVEFARQLIMTSSIFFYQLEKKDFY